MIDARMRPGMYGSTPHETNLGQAFMPSGVDPEHRTSFPVGDPTATILKTTATCRDTTSLGLSAPDPASLLTPPPSVDTLVLIILHSVCCLRFSLQAYL